VKKIYFAFFFACIITSISCNYIEEHSTPHIKILDPPKEGNINSVAILPFKNNSKEEKNAGDILRKCFFTHLNTTGYNLLKLQEIDERLALAGIGITEIDKKDIYQLGRIVKADAIVCGTVIKCCRNFYGVYSQVVFSAEVKMINARSSKIIWHAEHTEKIHSNSLPLSVLSIPVAVVDSSLNIREKVITDTADQLVKKFISGIPEKKFISPLHADVISIKSGGTFPSVHYRVQAGDTLYRISRKFYGDTSMVGKICQANNEIAVNSLKIGQELVMPEVPVLEDITDIHQIDRTKHKRTVYRIKWGDNLYKIASVILGDGKKWKIIYDTNKNEINNTEDVPVGQVIIIPLQIENQKLRGNTN